MSTEERAAAVFGEWRERADAGKGADPEDLIRSHPDLADALRRQFDAMRRAEAALRRGASAVRPAPAASLVGRTLGAWRLLAVLGSGGMGTVFLAESGGARAAVKVLHEHLLARPGFVERFLREAEVGRRVRHAGVVSALDAGEETVDGRTVRFLVMEHVEGRTLRALLDEAGRLPEALVRHVGRETARALAAIHAAGAVHRDLKPENVIVTGENVVKVMDLGVARLEGEAARLSQTGAFVGSLEYGAPEQFRDPGGVDARADLHALGLLLYELSTGVHPFRADGFHAVVRRVLDETPRPAAELNPQLSPFLEEVMSTLLAKDRERRLASAAEAADLLDAAETSAWWHARSAAIRGATRRPLRRVRVPRETALHGRAAELEKLRELYERAKTGDGQVVLVEGEAGIGKSRLVDELVGALAQAGEDVNFLCGSYPPGGAATGTGAFATAYREHLGDDEAAVRAALPATPLLAPAFAALLRGDAAPPGCQPLTKESLQTVFVHATKSFAAVRPTIVLIDDLHFAPEEGRALFASVALAVPGHRVLLVGGARPTLDERWLRQIERLGHATRLSLTRLSPRDLVHLLRDSLRSEHVAEQLAGRIAVKSDGNPFFVFEILCGLRDGKYLTLRPDGTWATTREIRDIEVPSSILELVQGRVAELADDERNLLDVAACCGFEFDPLLVAAALGVAQIPAMQRLARIEKRHRLVRSVGARYAFDHHQVQEALYAGLHEKLREPYHAAIADVLEARHRAAAAEPGRTDGALSVELADHLLRGGQGARALRHLDAALTHLETTWRHDAAIRLADRALAVPGLLAWRERCELLLRKSVRLDLVGRRDEQERTLAEAKDAADATGDAGLSSRARSAAGWFLLHTGRSDEARSVVEEALALARNAGDLAAEGRATGTLGLVCANLGRVPEAVTHHERHLQIALDSGDRRQQIVALGALGSALRWLGRFDEARARQERRLELARELGDRMLEASATGGLGSVIRASAAHGAARELGERHLELARETGDRPGEVIALGNLASVRSHEFRYADAVSFAERCFELAREIGDRRGMAIILGNVSSSRVVLGDLPRARADAEAAVALCRELGMRDFEGHALSCLSFVADEEGDLARGLALAEEALALHRASGHNFGVSEALIAVGDLRRRAGDAEGARAAFVELIPLVRAQGRSVIELGARASIACLDGDKAAAAAAVAEAGADQFNARVIHFFWETTGDPAHLAEAMHRIEEMLENNPPEVHAAIVANSRVHRQIVAAAAKAGLAFAVRPGANG